MLFIVFKKVIYLLLTLPATEPADFFPLRTDRSRDERRPKRRPGSATAASDGRSGTAAVLSEEQAGPTRERCDEVAGTMAVRARAFLFLARSVLVRAFGAAPSVAGPDEFEFRAVETRKVRGARRFVDDRVGRFEPCDCCETSADKTAVNAFKRTGSTRGRGGDAMNSADENKGFRLLMTSPASWRREAEPAKLGGKGEVAVRSLLGTTSK